MAEISKRKIFVASEFCSKRSNSTGYFWSVLCEHLSSFCDLEVASIDKSDFGRQSLEGFSVSKRRFGWLGRAFALITTSLQFVPWILTRLGKNDTLITGSNPIFLLLLVPMTRRVRGFKWLLVVHDLYPWNLLPTGYLREAGFLFKWLRKLFLSVYMAADHIIVIGEDMRRLLLKEGLVGEDVSVIQNWVSEHDVRPRPKGVSGVLRDLGWDDEKLTVFQFFGNFGPLQDIDNMMLGLQNAKAINARFLLVGGGSHFSCAERSISKKQDARFAIFPSVPMEENEEMLSACDVAIVSLRDGRAGACVPSKAYFSLAASRPLLAIVEENSEIADAVSRHKLGWRVDPGDPAALSMLIDHICNSSNGINVDPRKVFLEFFEAKRAMSKLNALLQSKFL